MHPVAELCPRKSPATSKTEGEKKQIMRNKFAEAVFWYFSHYK